MIFGKHLQDVKPQGSKVHKWKYSQVYIGRFADLSSLQQGAFHAFCSFRKVEGYGGNKPSPSWVWPAGAEVHMQRKDLAVERTNNLV